CADLAVYTYNCQIVNPEVQFALVALRSTWRSSSSPARPSERRAARTHQSLNLSGSIRSFWANGTVRTVLSPASILSVEIGVTVLGTVPRVGQSRTFKFNEEKSRVCFLHILCGGG